MAPRVKSTQPNVVTELEAARKALTVADANRAAALDRRDRAVRAATKAGMTRRQVSAIAGVNTTRIQQILAARTANDA